MTAKPVADIKESNTPGMVCALCSVLHFFVDGLCAFAMIGWLSSAQTTSFLIYNFCAFALQLPLGALLDAAAGRSAESNLHSFISTALGVLLTFVGMFTAPAILGTGNALFHIGGGVLTIHEDETENLRGQALGIFVAPGALGLYLGTQASGFADEAFSSLGLVGVGVFLAVLLCALALVLFRERNPGTEYSAMQSAVSNSDAALLKASPFVSTSAAGLGPVSGTGSVLANPCTEAFIVCACFIVVILRSYVGMGVTFAWKTGFLIGLAATIMVVGGKMLGGICAAHLGRKRTVAVSLALSAILYLFSANAYAGLAALLLFNMTMPITLYILVERYRNLPGTCFGLLTLGLFLGYLPVFWGYLVPVKSNVAGACACVISLVLLAGAAFAAERKFRC